MTAHAVTIERTAALVALVLAVALATAFVMQYVFEIWPCPLCLEQRVPYYVAIPLALAIVAAGRINAPACVAWGGMAILAIVLVWSARLGVFHAGVEWGWWQGPTDCAVAQPITRDAGSLLAQIQRTRVVNCAEAGWRFLGISLAGYNALISIGLGLLAAMAAARVRLPLLTPKSA